MEEKREKEKIAKEKKPNKSLKPLVTLLPPTQKEEGEKWLRELEREAVILIQRRLQ